jgi:hypothetical protein
MNVPKSMNSNCHEEGGLGNQERLCFFGAVELAVDVERAARSRSSRFRLRASAAANALWRRCSAVIFAAAA